MVAITTILNQNWKLSSVFDFKKIAFAGKSFCGITATEDLYCADITNQKWINQNFKAIHISMDPYTSVATASANNFAYFNYDGIVKPKFEQSGLSTREKVKSIDYVDILSCFLSTTLTCIRISDFGTPVFRQPQMNLNSFSHNGHNIGCGVTLNKKLACTYNIQSDKPVWTINGNPLFQNIIDVKIFGTRKCVLTGLRQVYCSLLDTTEFYQVAFSYSFTAIALNGNQLAGINGKTITVLNLQ